VAAGQPGAGSLPGQGKKRRREECASAATEAKSSTTQGNDDISAPSEPTVELCNKRLGEAAAAAGTTAVAQIEPATPHVALDQVDQEDITPPPAKRQRLDANHPLSFSDVAAAASAILMASPPTAELTSAASAPVSSCESIGQCGMRGLPSSEPVSGFLVIAALFLEVQNTIAQIVEQSNKAKLEQDERMRAQDELTRAQEQQFEQTRTEWSVSFTAQMEVRTVRKSLWSAAAV
jgi:hypothetical protein